MGWEIKNALDYRIARFYEHWIGSIFVIEIKLDWITSNLYASLWDLNRSLVEKSHLSFCFCLKTKKLLTEVGRKAWICHHK